VPIVSWNRQILAKHTRYTPPSWLGCLSAYVLVFGDTMEKVGLQPASFLCNTKLITLLQGL